MKKLILAAAMLAGCVALADFKSALDCSGLTFTTGGNAKWTEQTEVKFKGSSALRSGAITDNQETWLETKVTGPCMVEFMWRVESESGCDVLSVSVDGDLRYSVSGSGAGWVRKAVVVEGGAHTLRWTYRKDVSVSTGADCGWLDAVDVMPTPESMTITFVTNGDVELDPMDVVPGTTYGALPTLKEEDARVFAGWYLDSELTQKVADGDYVAFRDHTLYAKWDISVSVLDTYDFSFESYSDPFWTAVEDADADGGYVLRAPNTDNYWNSGELEVYTQGPGTLSFMWRVDGRDDASVNLYCDYQCDSSFANDKQRGEWREYSVDVVENLRFLSGGRTGALCLKDFIWTAAPASMQISFVSNGGSEIADQEVYPGTKYYELPAPERTDGYEFAGWYLDEELTQKAETYGNVAFRDHTLYAKWSIPVSVLNGEDISFESESDCWVVEKDAGATGGYAISYCDREGCYSGLRVIVPNSNGILRCRARQAADTYLEFNPPSSGYRSFKGPSDWREISIDVRGGQGYTDSEDEWYEYESLSVYIYAGRYTTFCGDDRPLDPGAVMLSDFEWSPAPESITICFDAGDEVEVAPVEADTASGTYPELPKPTHTGWKFISWMVRDYDGYWTWVVPGETAIPFHDVTLVAEWEKPVSVLNTDDLKFTSSATWCTYDDHDRKGQYYAAGGLAVVAKAKKGDKPKAVKSWMQATLTGPMILSFRTAAYEEGGYCDYDDEYMSFSSCTPGDEVYEESAIERRGSCKYNVYLDGKAQPGFGISANYCGEYDGYDGYSGHMKKHKLYIPKGKHTVKWELSGTPHLYRVETWKGDVRTGTRYETVNSGLAKVRDFEVVRLDPQEDLAGWMRMVRDNGAWIAGDFPRFADAYKAAIAAGAAAEDSAAEYKARILYAVSRLGVLAEDAQFQKYAKTFGYTVDFIRMSMSGKPTLNKSTAAVNAMADSLLALATPAIEDALDALAGIPEDWNGMVEFSTEEWPVDEATYVDAADVLFARASLLGALASVNYLAAYDLSVDWTKMSAVMKAEETGDALMKFLAAQPAFFSKVRDATRLVASRMHFRDALEAALLADGLASDRPDDGMMRFVEYDPDDKDRIEFARVNTQRILEALDHQTDVNFKEIADEYDSAFLGDGEHGGARLGDYNYTLLPNEDGLTRVYIGAIFEGGITRALLPPMRTNDDDAIVPNFDAMLDPTIGGIFPDMTHDHVASLSERFGESHELDHGEAPDMDTMPLPGEKVSLDYADYRGYTASGLPSGWKWDKNKGVLTGTAASTFTVTFKKGSATAKETVTVGPKPAALLFVAEDCLGSVSVTGTGSYNVGATAKAVAAVMPGYAFGGWFDANGAMVSPLASYSFKMARETVSLTARTVPLSADFLDAKTTDEPYEFSAGAVQDLTPFNVYSASPFSVSASGLPKGMTIACDVETDDGVFTGDVHVGGAAAKAGVYYATIVAKNNGGFKKSHVVKLVVGGASESEVNTAGFEWPDMDDPRPMAGTFCEYVVEVPDSSAKSAPKSVKAKGLPGGLVAEYSDGVLYIYGTPAAAGKFTMDFTVTYMNKKTARAVKTVVVNDRGSVYIPTGVIDNDPDGKVRGTVVAGGVKQYGQTVKFTATTKDKKKWFFGGWYLDRDCETPAGEALPGADWKAAALSAQIGEMWSPGDGMYALFVTKDDDYVEIEFWDEDRVWRVEDGLYSTYEIGVQSVTKATLTAKGVPAGTKFSGGRFTVTKTSALVPGFHPVSITATTASGISVTEDMYVFVPNVTQACDEEKLFGLNTDEEGYSGDYMQAGVKQSFSLEDLGISVEEGWTLAVTGLPKGWTYNKNTGVISGVATKAGKTTVTFTVSTKSGKKTTSYKATATFDLAELPAWATGTFVGMTENVYCDAKNKDKCWYANAYITMDVTSVGAVSGWCFDASGGKVAFSSSGFEVDEDGLSASIKDKKGRFYDIKIMPYENLGVEQGIATVNYNEYDRMCSNPWAIKGAEPLPEFADGDAFEYDPLQGGALTLKFGQKGAVTCVYAYGKNSTSGSTQICDITWNDGAWTANIAVSLAAKLDKKKNVLVPALVEVVRLRIPADGDGRPCVDEAEVVEAEY